MMGDYHYFCIMMYGPERLTVYTFKCNYFLINHNEFSYFNTLIYMQLQKKKEINQVLLICFAKVLKRTAFETVKLLQLFKINQV